MVVVVVVVAHHIPAGQSGPLGSGAHHQPTQVTPQSVSAAASPGAPANLSVCFANLEIIKSCTCPALPSPHPQRHLTCNTSGDVWLNSEEM